MDAKCRRLTATWVREKHVSDQDIEVCDFFEQLERAGRLLAVMMLTTLAHLHVRQYACRGIHKQGMCLRP